MARPDVSGRTQKRKDRRVRPDDPRGPEAEDRGTSLPAQGDQGKPVELGTFDPIERRREKQAARDKDEEDLRAGRVTPEELSKRNGFFSALDIKNAKIVLPKRSKL